MLSTHWANAKPHRTEFFHSHHSDYNLTLRNEVTQRVRQVLYTSVGVGTMILATTLVLVSHRGVPARVKSMPAVQEVVATVETEPVGTGSDSADDPTLWVNPSDA